MPPLETFADPLNERLVAFVRGIGFEVRAATVSQMTFLPELEIRDGAILVDEARSHHPGDILHEAGDLAVADPAERDAPLRSCGMNCEPRMAAVAPFLHMSRWLR
jgi:hypothetical protein